MNDDKMHSDALADRRSRNDGGFTSSVNIGWIELGTQTTTQPRHIEPSQNGVAHSEERLVPWATAQGADLSLAPTAPGEQLRVKRLYTERAPCRQEDNVRGDPPRYARVGTDRSCYDYLTRVLHADVEVIHSVDNAPAPHEQLRHGEWVKFHKDREVLRVLRAYQAKRATFNPVPQGLVDLFIGHRTTILGLQPMSLSSFNVNNYRVDVTQAATTAVAAIQAWQPPVPAVAPLGPPPGPPGPPPGPPGPPDPPPGRKRAPDGDPDAPGPVGKRALIGVP